MSAVALFAVTYQIDSAANRGEITLPSWVINGSPDSARQILTAIAATVITVVGLVFSITIVALTLARDATDVPVISVISTVHALVRDAHLPRTSHRSKDSTRVR